MHVAAPVAPPHATPLFLQPRPERQQPQKRTLTQEEIEEIAFAFSTLDSEKTGGVTHKQLKVALRAMGFPVTKADVEELLRKHGEADRERLDFDAFRAVVADRMCERTVTDDLRRSFQLFDMHGEGKIDVFSLRKVIKSLGLDVGEDEAQAMIDEFDLDRDGKISEAEFMAIMQAGDD